MNTTDKQVLIETVVSKFKFSSIPIHDLKQEAEIAFLKAENTFNPQKNVQFATYASRVIKNRLIDVLRAQKEQTAQLTEYNAITYTLESQFLVAEQTAAIKNALSNCTQQERDIFKNYLLGHSYSEIADKFQTTTKKIDNTIQKLKKIIISLL